MLVNFGRRYYQGQWTHPSTWKSEKSSSATYIALIPKKKAARELKDFTAIGLLEAFQQDYCQIGYNKIEEDNA